MKTLLLLILGGLLLCCSPNLLKYGHERHDLQLIEQNDSIAIFICTNNCPYRDTFYFKGWHKNPNP